MLKLKYAWIGLIAFSAYPVTADDHYESQHISALEIEQPGFYIEASSPRMKCFVDTPAWDEYRYGGCFSAGWARTTSAVFKIDNVPSNFKIYWSNSACSSSSSTCTLPIRQYNNITLSADVLDLSNNTFSSTSAKAHYEGFD